MAESCPVSLLTVLYPEYSILGREVVIPLLCLHFKGRLEKTERLLDLLTLKIPWKLRVGQVYSNLEVGEASWRRWLLDVRLE